MVQQNSEVFEVKPVESGEFMTPKRDVNIQLCLLLSTTSLSLRRAFLEGDKTVVTGQCPECCLQC